jgi:adenylate cyclase
MSDPETPKAFRKLAAILAADIAGYSALMGADEEATVRDLKAHQAVVLPMIGDHGGRVIDTAGDGILAEFASVLGAVKCALAVQQSMDERNAVVVSPRRMQFRIGINQGDVIVDDARVYGDGVNVAARLESIAEPGGICVSAKVRDEINGRIDAEWEDLGQQSLKNITQPIRVYRVKPAKRGDPAPLPKPLLALPDKPSIAVLPFANLSGDKEQEYFSDGITEDIITELSRFSELFVIARNSSFQYKGKSPDIRHVGRELGVRYVLEGSVRRAGDRVRITSQLIDASTGAHRWAERYDRKLEDVFAVQDELARTIAALLAAHVRKAEVERTLLKLPAAWQAYDYYLRATDTFASFSSSLYVHELYETRRLLEESLSADPMYARAYSTLALTYWSAYINPLDQDHLEPTILERAHDLARRSVQLDPNLPQTHTVLGIVLAFKRLHAGSLAEFERAVELNPNYTDWRYGAALVYSGEFHRAIEVLKVHMRLDPFYPPVTTFCVGIAHYMLKHYSEALRPLRECLSRVRNFRGAHTVLAATYAQLEQFESARAEAAEVLRIEPAYTIERYLQVFPLKSTSDADHLFDGARKAGLPER